MTLVTGDSYTKSGPNPNTIVNVDLKVSTLKTALLGHPVLRNPSKHVGQDELKSDRIQQLIDDMITTMHEYEGVGLAAPQVHVPLQIAVIEVKENRRYPWAPTIPLLTLVNPEFVRRSESLQEGWEGCLSVEGLRGIVPRSKEVEIRYWNRYGTPETLTATGFLAVIVQHEVDHLEGMIFLDRMRDLRTLSHQKEFERYWLKPDSS